MRPRAEAGRRAAIVSELTGVSPEHRRFLLLEQGLGAGVVNAVLNALIAWLSFRSTMMVPFWGQQSIGADTIGTCIILPLLTTLIATPLCRARVRAGALSPLAPTPTLGRVLGGLPTGTFTRGLVVGVLTAMVVAPPTLLALRWLGVTAWPLATFIGFKGVFGGMLGAVVTPIVAWGAIAAPEPVVAGV